MTPDSLPLIDVKPATNDDYPALPAEGLLHTDGWAGRLQQAVTVIGRTPRRYRIRAEGYVKLPRCVLERGETALVPQYAVTFPAPPMSAQRHAVGLCVLTAAAVVAPPVLADAHGIVQPPSR